MTWKHGSKKEEDCVSHAISMERFLPKKASRLDIRLKKKHSTSLEPQSLWPFIIAACSTEKKEHLHLGESLFLSNNGSMANCTASPTIIKMEPNISKSLIAMERKMG